MNRNLPFGMHNIGYSYVIKLNVKLTKKDAEELQKHFHMQLWITPNEKHSYDKDICLHRIEGSIPSRDIQTFIMKLSLAKEFTKIFISEAKIADWLEVQIPHTLPEFGYPHVEEPEPDAIPSFFA
jgi:hypothetical protein